MREIKEVVDSLPQHVWKDHDKWYVHPRARDARVEASDSVANANDENSCDLTAPPPSSSRNRTVAEVRVDADDNGPLSVFRRAKERQPDISGRVVPVIAVLAKISPGFAELMKGGDARYGLRVAESLEAAQAQFVPEYLKTAPSYLDGSTPGDIGFDPWGLVALAAPTQATDAFARTAKARNEQMLAMEPSNHEYMLRKHDVSSYVEQLVYLASPVQTHGDTVAAALRGLRLLAEAEVAPRVQQTLIGPMKLIPVLTPWTNCVAVWRKPSVPW